MASHRRFAQKYGLRCHLIADPDGTILKRLGIVNPVGGRARRTTFIIDKAGIVCRIYENVSVKGHADEVLAAVGGL